MGTTAILNEHTHQALTLASVHENTLKKQFKRSSPRAWAP